MLASMLAVLMLAGLAPAQGERAADLAVGNFPPDVPNVIGRKAALPVLVANAGPDVARDVVVTFEIPPGMAYEEIVCPPGWRAKAPAPGTNVATCRVARLRAGDSQTLALVVRALKTTAGGEVASVRTVSSATPDPNAENNSAAISGYLAGPAPKIRSIQVVERADGEFELIIDGEGFLPGLNVILHTSTFVDEPEIWPGGTKIIQRGRTYLTDLTIDEAAPVGARVFVAVENPDLGYREIRWRRRH
jgi:hypothetical protein